MKNTTLFCLGRMNVASMAAIKAKIRFDGEHNETGHASLRRNSCCIHFRRPNSSRVFRACAACHSLEANRNMTGPSLAGVWNRKAGGLASFTRYSDAMKLSGITWDEQSLDGYLKNPAEFMPGNHMTFP